MRSVFVLLLFFSIRLSAQTDFYEKYYPLIDKAEYAFSTDKFQEAVVHYTEAFRAVDKPLARDLYNGIVCYYLSGNIDGAKPWLLQLAKKGIDPYVLENQTAFQEPNIRKQWETFRPVYEQIQSTFHPDKDEATETLINTIEAYTKEIRDIYSKLPENAFEEDSTSVPDSLDAELIKKSFDLVGKLYDEVSFQAIDHFLKNGFRQEEAYGIMDESLLSDGLRGFLSNIRFYAQLHTTDQSTVLGSPKSELIEKFNEKLLDEVGKGHIHRDYVLEIIKGDYKLENLFFVRALLPEELDCEEHKEQLFIKPKPDNASRYFDSLSGESEELQIAKGKYSIFRNEFFLMNEVPIYEDLIIEDCEQLERMKEELIQVENP